MNRCKGLDQCFIKQVKIRLTRFNKFKRRYKDLDQSGVKSK